MLFVELPIRCLLVTSDINGTQKTFRRGFRLYPVWLTYCAVVSDFCLLAARERSHKF